MQPLLSALLHLVSTKIGEYDQEIPQSLSHAHCRPTRGTITRKSHRTTAIKRHQKDKRSIASRPHQDDCRTRKDTKQCTTKRGTNTDPHNGGNKQQRVNNDITASLEWTTAKASWGSNAFYWCQIFTLHREFFGRHIPFSLGCLENAHYGFIC